MHIYHVSSSNRTAGNGDYIGTEKAKEIALDHDRLAASDVTFLKEKPDYEDGIQVYEIEFYSGNMEYEYEIDANSGAVLDYEWDAADPF